MRLSLAPFHHPNRKQLELLLASAQYKAGRLKVQAPTAPTAFPK